MDGFCKLCNKRSDIQLSHIVPKFIGKWLKKTSATGYLRNNETFKRRSQDIWKEYWLCSDCESLFSKWEDEFAAKIFYPFVEEKETEANYNSWLLKFCASLSWRTIKYMRSKNSETNRDIDYINQLNKAEKYLSEFLLGNSDNLNDCEQHLIPLEKINSISMLDVPSNLNRYFLRYLAMDIVNDDKNIFIYTKLPRFIVLGIIKASNPELMNQSLISVSDGRISPKGYFPPGFWEYIIDKANEIKELSGKIPREQQTSLEKFMIENPEIVTKSKSFEAFIADVALFQDKAFKK